MRATRLLLLCFHGFLAHLALAAGATPARAQDPFPNPPPFCETCLVGPVHLTATRGKPARLLREFEAEPNRRYQLVMQGLAPGQPLVAMVRVNDKQAVHLLSHQPTVIPLDLGFFNALEVRLVGYPDGVARLAVITDRPLPPERRSCGEQRTFFGIPPTPVGQLRSIGPLGNLNPPDHVYPTHHIYPHPVLSDPADPTSPPVPVAVHAPGRLTLVAVARLGDTPETHDYQLFLKPCAEVRMYYIHTAFLTREVQAAVGSFDDALCVGSVCAKRVSLPVEPGQVLGWTDPKRNIAFDFGLVDTRGADGSGTALGFANPDRYRLSPDELARIIRALGGVEPTPALISLAQTVLPARLFQYCALDYYPEPLRSELGSLLATSDGSIRRTAPPLCGEHMRDLPGRARGNWFPGPGDKVFFGERGLALAHDEVQPEIPAISVGDPDGAFPPPLPPGLYTFVPAAAGRVNRPFHEVTADGIYCYEGLSYRGPPRDPPPAVGILLLQLSRTDPSRPADRLRVEHFAAAGSCVAGPAGFSAPDSGAVYQR